jgi:hypothetical protein
MLESLHFVSVHNISTAAMFLYNLTKMITIMTPLAEHINQVTTLKVSFTQRTNVKIHTCACLGCLWNTFIPLKAFLAKVQYYKWFFGFVEILHVFYYFEK